MENDFGVNQAVFAVQRFVTSEDGLQALKDECHSRGFSVKKKRDNSAQKIDKVATIFYYVCTRAGIYKNYRPHLSAETRVRNTKTQLCDCRFKASVLLVGDAWGVQIDNAAHNHEPTANVKSLRSARRIYSEQLGVIKAMMNSGESVKATLVALQAQDPKCMLIDQDLYNARQKLAADDNDGTSEMQVLIAELQQSGVQHAVKLDGNRRCTQLLIVPKDTQALTLEFPDLLYMDSTYRTNKYNMPLLHVARRTNTNKSFIVAAFRDAMGEQAIPSVIVTDRELALVNAIASVFSEARHILCAWHIAKNVLAHCKRFFPAASGQRGDQVCRVSWDDFSRLWSKLIISTLCREKFFRDWCELKTQVRQEVSDYIKYQWMTPWKTRFCATFLQDARHFGVLTTSRVEGCHAALKAWIPNMKLNLLKVYRALQTHTRIQYNKYVVERERQSQTVLMEIRTKEFFSDLHTVVSHQALRMVHAEYQKAERGPTTQCRSYLASVYGLPCSHIIAVLIDSSRGTAAVARLQPSHFHTFWLLDKTKTTRFDSASAVLSPSRVVNPRCGQARGTRRVLLQFERVEMELAPAKPLRRCGYCKVPANHNRLTCQKRSSE